MTFSVPPTGLDPWDAEADSTLTFLHNEVGTERQRALDQEAILNGRIVAASTGSKEFFKNSTAQIGVGLARWYAPVNLTLLFVIISCGIAPVGGAVGVDLKRNGVTVYPTTKPACPDGQNVGVLDVPGIVTLTAKIDYLTADITSTGGSSLGSEVNMQVVYKLT